MPDLNQNQSQSLPQLSKEQAKVLMDTIKKEKIFNIIKDLHKDFQFLNPDESVMDPGVRSSFLSEPNFSDRRAELKRTIQAIRDLMANTSEKDDFLALGKKLVEDKRALLLENKKAIEEKTAALYKSLRQLDVFYTNSGKASLDDLSILAFNQSLTQKDPDNLIFNTLEKEVSNRFLQVDQSQSVGYIVCPHFPGKEALARFADLANKNKALFFCSYRDLPNVEAVLDFLPDDGIGGAEKMWSNVVVFVNTLVTKDGIHLSPAAAVGGRLYDTKISQPVAGYMHSNLKGISGLRFQVNDAQLQLLKDKGVIPLLTAWEKVLAFGMWTAYKGTDIDFEQYAIVRVRDWISRSLANHLRKCVFNLTERKTLQSINMQVQSFLDKLTQQGIIEKGVVEYFDREHATPDQVDIRIALTYLYALRLFTYKFISSKNRTKENESEESKSR